MRKEEEERKLCNFAAEPHVEQQPDKSRALSKDFCVFLIHPLYRKLERQYEEEKEELATKMISKMIKRL